VNTKPPSIPIPIVKKNTREADPFRVILYVFAARWNICAKYAALFTSILSALKNYTARWVLSRLLERQFSSRAVNKNYF
jgi:hypothetical protein